MALISINGQKKEVDSGITILDAARAVGVYIPVLCSHPDLKPFHSIELTDRIYQGEQIFENEPHTKIEDIKSCGLCVVELEGKNELLPSCSTQIENGMVIHTDTPKLIRKRQESLAMIMANHPHSCLTCSQRQGCAIISGDCSNSVVMNERCCEITGNCELQRLVDYIGILPETPKYHHPGIPRIYDGNLFLRDFNLCINCGRCVRACQQLRGVYALGAVINNGKLIIGTINGPLLSDADCRYCGACVEVCPTGAIQDRKKPRLKEFGDYVPCRLNCPADVDIPSYLRLIADGDYQKSAEVISHSLSFPHTLGKICFHPCETECRRNNIFTEFTESNSINIRAAKDFAMSHSITSNGLIIKNKTDKIIAVIGSGPAGLTAAYYLALKGHNVTVYEKEEKIGGMLRYGIPRYRLAEETLEKDLARILQSGINIRTNIEIGSNHPISSLKSDGANAILIAAGLSKSKKLTIEIPDSENILYGIEFLNAVAKNKFPHNYFDLKNIIIVGGGNVATDAARTAVRLGAAKVTIVCLEKFNEMPAYKQEITESLEEGIEILNEWGIQSIVQNESSVLSLHLVKCISLFDDSGIFNPKYNDTVKNNLSANNVIICIGQKADESFIVSEDKDNLFFNGLIKNTSPNQKTAYPGIFAAGDIYYGPASVIDAVASGKKAAREIDAYLGGDGIIASDEILDIEYDYRKGRINGFCNYKRLPVNLSNPAERIKNFQLIDLGYDEEAVKLEVSRCLQCNLRVKIKSNPHPPDMYLEFTIENLIKVNDDCGVVQLLDDNRNVFVIKGSDNIKTTLLNFYENGKDAKYFMYEYNPLFSKRESELIQQFLQKYGSMPDSGDELDDLF